MIVLVSSCILGYNCKYNGKNNKNENVIKFLEGKEVIHICPEILYGMKIPRLPAEIKNGMVTESTGKVVDDDYRKAAEYALNEIKNKNIDLVILQSRSPTCGVNNIYDGTFSGKLKKGSGLFAELLRENNYNIADSEDFV